MASVYLRDVDLPSLRRPTEWEMASLPSVSRRYGQSILPPEDDCRICKRISYSREPFAYSRTRDSSDVCKNHMQEMQEELNMYKEELAKQEKLINQLTNMESSSNRQPSMDYSKIYGRPEQSDFTNVLVQAEATMLQVKVDELQSQLELRDKKIEELIIERDAARDGEATQLSIVEKLSEKLAKVEIETEDVNNSLRIQELERDNQLSNARILELESKLRMCNKEREESSQRLSNSDETAEILKSVKELRRENAELTNKLSTANKNLERCETQIRLKQDALNDIRGEHEIEKKKLTLIWEKKQKEFEDEIKHLKEKLESTNASWMAAKQEVDKNQDVRREIKKLENCARNSEVQFTAFKESLAKILSSVTLKVAPVEEEIKARVEDGVFDSKNKSKQIIELERKVCELTDKLEQQYKANNILKKKTGQGMPEITELEERLRNAEKELSSVDHLRSKIKEEKQKFWRHLERIGHVLSLDNLTFDVGFERTTEFIVTRMLQLLKLETTSLVDSNAQIHSLQRKLVNTQEQLETKEQQVNRLHKKVVSLEAEIVGACELKQGMESEFARNRKLLKLVEKYKRDLTEAQLEIQDLKTNLIYAREAEMRNIMKERELDSLEGRVGQLEHVRRKQADEIVGLENMMESTSRELFEKKETARHTVHSLAIDLQNSKLCLEEITKRERQLLDFRMMIARMLGLDVTILTVPDHEIISRLEKLILSNQANATSAAALDREISGVDDRGFQAGYRQATRSLSPHRSLSPSRRDLHPRSPAKKKLDSNIY